MKNTKLFVVLGIMGLTTAAIAGEIKTKPLIASSFNWQTKEKNFSNRILVKVGKPVKSLQTIFVTQIDAKGNPTQSRTYPVQVVSADICEGIIYSGLGDDGWIVVYDWRLRNIRYCGDQLKLLAEYPEYEEAATVFEKSRFDNEPKLYRYDNTENR